MPRIPLAVSLLTVLTLAACGGTSSGVTALSPVPLQAAVIASGTSADLTILETTDLHTNIRSYDYFKLADNKSIGFERTATLIKAARAESKNTLLFDNGDTIQGTSLSDYQALVNPITCDQTLAMYKVMNAAGFDAGGIGNHEFNFGLPYLAQVTGSKFNVNVMPAVANQKSCAGPNFPQVLANVLSTKDGAPIFKPYVILSRTMNVTGPDGKAATALVKVGVIGFTPPTVMSWDKRWLDGNVSTDGIKELATKYVPEMRAKGADIVVAISHGGLDNATYLPSMENGNWHLSQVPGIDAMLIGHSHQVFPNAKSTVAQFNLPGVDKVAGLVNGVPTVMANFWGQHLGVIKLKMAYDGKAWVIDKSKTTVEARSIKNADGSFVDPDPTVATAIDVEHQATIAYVKTPVGTTNFKLSSYFADVGDVSAIQVVNQAQAAYVAAYIKASLPQYAALPVLSVSAPFKSGFAGGSDFTDVAAGNVAINNAADLYLYPNTIYAVKVTGNDVRNWLETAAKRFNLIDPNATAAQPLISTFPGYNFDMFTSPDVRYEIDVTQPLGSRIRNLTYLGAPMSLTQEFVIATNNYRASGGGNFPGIDGTKTIYASPDANRDVLISFIKDQKNLTLAANGSSRSWFFTKVSTAGPVTFKSAVGTLALAQAAGLNNVSLLAADDGTGTGLSVFQIDLSK
ncbi:bifunctional 2',3'-cyclic-nucleotide 2'-phosphodiesterase/3'-nucleotidase [Actimicrobium antarcticum]|uniref:Bifunctional 2',3'-cyclic-nucleotide 2'-phosphodiesterase/3'-nucleotidase n=1 Tax=Actimicrobium antarcticum TaxID=1051899 RepID=A0ABP7TRN1_9BURK